MPHVVRMPKLGMEMQEGVMLEWYVKEGEDVEAGDEVCEIESEKVVEVVEARSAGTVESILLSVGDIVEPGTPMAVILGDGESLDDIDIDSETPEDIRSQTDESYGEVDQSAPAVQREGATEGPADRTENAEVPASAYDEPSREAALKITPAARKRAEELGIDPKTAAASGPEDSITSADIEAIADAIGDGAAATPKATPRARQLAREHDVELAMLTGTGPEDAICAEDVEAAAAGVANPSKSSAPAANPPAVDTDQPSHRGPTTTARQFELSGMRQTIADRLSKSYRDAVHVTVQRDIRVDDLQEAKTKLEDGLDADLSLVDVLLVVLSEALADYPTFNATFEDGEVSVQPGQDVGLAVDVEEGLLTPVITDVQDRRLTDIAHERKRLTERVQTGEYDGSDLAGGSITVTNLGPFGIDSFTPIIDPPQVAILGVGRVKERAVRDESSDGVTFQSDLNISLSFDHRVADGADAARLLDAIAGYAAEPWPVLIDRL